MAQAYIYMECPVSGQTLTLGKLTIQSGVGTFQYSPDAVQESIWVPDPFRYPLSARAYSVPKNGGVPGFIDDAMPDGWGSGCCIGLKKAHWTRYSFCSNLPTATGRVTSWPDWLAQHRTDWARRPQSPACQGA